MTTSTANQKVLSESINVSNETKPNEVRYITPTIYYLYTYNNT